MFGISNPNFIFTYFHQFGFLCDNSPSLMVSLDFSAWAQSFSACQTWKQKVEGEGRSVFPPDGVSLVPTLGEAHLHLLTPRTQPGVIADSFSS